MARRILLMHCTVWSFCNWLSLNHAGSPSPASQPATDPRSAWLLAACLPAATGHVSFLAPFPQPPLWYAPHPPTHLTTSNRLFVALGAGGRARGYVNQSTPALFSVTAFRVPRSKCSVRPFHPRLVVSLLACLGLCACVPVFRCIRLLSSLLLCSPVVPFFCLVVGLVSYYAYICMYV
ncbi:uncharacterized protein J3D65DRAFT_640938 [Phyllosticta citribraziliensis]|uniref:Uncharacterized protein n=1 Tax=Phyllosticta citribraziliensis TaxID=989973 RepID=A0ABR1L544_9PEZI